ncbi:MAG: Gfo/Idh/MocA family oxidoreductase [Armatimonadetes bacterium]|nr:Gfo/Idh/MocA family oxidoreductase [Armatimonadota bacterium]
MIRVGIAGLGGMGRMHAQGYAALPNATIVAGADLEPDRRDRFASEHPGVRLYDDFRHMVEADLDAVDICLPSYLHSEAAVAFAQVGRHILCEKPMALTLEECDAMIAASERSGTTLMVAQVLRFYPEFLAVKEIADSGRYGKVLWASASRVGARPAWSWRGWFTDPQRSGGAVLDLHIHDIDFLSWLLGRPASVSAAGVISPEGSLDTLCTSLTGFDCGAVASARAAWLNGLEHPFVSSLIVDFEHATLTHENGVVVYPKEGGVERPEMAPVTVPVDVGINITDLGGYLVEVQYFVDCLDSGVKPDRVPPESSRQAVEICLAARRSVETGQPVRLP